MLCKSVSKSASLFSVSFRNPWLNLSWLAFYASCLKVISAAIVGDANSSGMLRLSFFRAVCDLSFTVSQVQDESTLPLLTLLSLREFAEGWRWEVSFERISALDLAEPFERFEMSNAGWGSLSPGDSFLADEEGRSCWLEEVARDRVRGGLDEFLLDYGYLGVLASILSIIFSMLSSSGFSSIFAIFIGESTYLLGRFRGSTRSPTSDDCLPKLEV